MKGKKKKNYQERINKSQAVNREGSKNAGAWTHMSRPSSLSRGPVSRGGTSQGLSKDVAGTTLPILTTQDAAGGAHR